MKIGHRKMINKHGHCPNFKIKLKNFTPMTFLNNKIGNSLIVHSPVGSDDLHTNGKTIYDVLLNKGLEKN